MRLESGMTVCVGLHSAVAYGMRASKVWFVTSSGKRLRTVCCSWKYVEFIWSSWRVSRGTLVHWDNGWVCGIKEKFVYKHVGSSACHAIQNIKIGVLHCKEHVSPYRGKHEVIGWRSKVSIGRFWAFNRIFTLYSRGQLFMCWNVCLSSLVFWCLIYLSIYWSVCLSYHPSIHFFVPVESRDPCTSWAHVPLSSISILVFFEKGPLSLCRPHWP